MHGTMNIKLLTYVAFSALIRTHLGVLMRLLWQV